jgi:hypothetical protein
MDFRASINGSFLIMDEILYALAKERKVDNTEVLAEFTAKFIERETIKRRNER